MDQFRRWGIKEGVVSMIIRFLTCAIRHTNKGNTAQWPGLCSVWGQEAHDPSSLFFIFAYGLEQIILDKTTLNYE